MEPSFLVAGMASDWRYHLWPVLAALALVALAGLTARLTLLRMEDGDQALIR